MGPFIISYSCTEYLKADRLIFLLLQCTAHSWTAPVFAHHNFPYQ